MSSAPQWRALNYIQPDMDLQTSIQYDGRTKRLHVNDEDCREALIYDIGDWMGEVVRYNEDDPTPWERKKAVVKPAAKNLIRLNVESLRQAKGTKLSLYISPSEDGCFICTRSCCTAGLADAVNTLVSLPALLLNPDRYTGDWWEQTPEQLLKKNYGDPVIEYWGVDNSMLHHPALVSIMFGLLRQAVILHYAGELADLSKEVSPKAVRQALFNSDEKAALKLVQKAKPWLFCPTAEDYFPISGNGKWELFLNLHRALYKHGFGAVFGSVTDGWELSSRGIKTLSGSHSYFRQKGKVANIAKLAQKVA